MPGDRAYFYKGNTEEEAESVWKMILKYGVLSASHFEIHFPDDPVLGEGKEEFRRLPLISEEPWSGMAGAVTVKGEMTSVARSLFLRIIDHEDIRLWDFVLIREGRKLLIVQDFNLRILTESFVKDFLKKFFLSRFERVPEPETELGEAVGFSKSEVAQLFQELVSEIEKSEPEHPDEVAFHCPLCGRA